MERDLASLLSDLVSDLLPDLAWKMKALALPGTGCDGPARMVIYLFPNLTSHVVRLCSATQADTVDDG